MPALANYGGDDAMRPRGPLYCSPHKRSKLNSHNRGVEKKLRLQEPSSLNSLPDECLYEILRRLPGPQERSNSACVSKRWLMLLSSISSSELLRKKKLASCTKKLVLDLNIENVEDEHQDEQDEIENMGCLTRCLRWKEVTDVRVSAVAVCTSTRGGLEKLLIRGSHPTRGLTDVGLSSISKCCPSLRVLSMFDAPFVTDAGLAELAGGCPMLEKLELSNYTLITTRGLVAVAEKCPNLVSVVLDSCVNIGNDGIQAIGRLCPKIDCVSIKDCDLIGDQGISGLMSAASSSLTKLKLQNLDVSDLAIACVGYYGKAITELSLINLQNVAERGFWCMGNAMNLLELKSFFISSCHGVTDVAMEAVAKGCPNLKHLFIRKCFNLSDIGLKTFIDKSNALEHLQLGECHRISLVGILAGLVNANSKLKSLAVARCMGIKDIVAHENAIPTCKSLQALTISDCPGLTSASLAVLGKICPNVIHLDLSGCVGITDVGLLPLISSSDEGLIKVNLRGCANLTDSTISALVKQHGDTLQVLNLDGCNKLTDRILLEISQQCTQLEELNMSRADVTDYGIALLASARHLNIRFLSFSGCSKVTPRSLPLLGNMGTTLVGLNLQHCNIIKAHGISSLEEKLWWCDILS